MPLTTTLVFDIRPLADVQHCDGAVKLTFGDGSVAYLEETNPTFDTLVVLLECGSPSQPVGVVLDAADRVVDLNEAYEVTVRSICVSPDSLDRLKVSFWGFSSVCYLAKDHPEFERLRATLTGAATTSARLWVANHSQMVKERVTNGAESEIWWKIMDARSK
jgi:hypothetical protein